MKFKRVNLPHMGWARFLGIALLTIMFGAILGILGDGLKGEQPFVYWIAKLSGALKETDKAADNYRWWAGQMALMVVVLIMLAAWLYEKLPNNAPVKDLGQAEGLDGCRVLIHCLSSQRWKIQNVDSAACLVQGKHSYPIPSNLQEAVALCDRIKDETGSLVNLQPLIRLVVTATELKKLVLLCSAESQHDFKLVKSLLQQHFGMAHLEIETNPKPLDIENVGAIYQCLDQEIGQLQQTFHDNQIVVDATGGQKPPSIAAAAITLHNNMRCCYVSTATGKVYTYQLRYDHRSSIGP